ncbi:MAG: ABC transporter substrate-binding protein [Actinomycetota bacterium]
MRPRLGLLALVALLAACGGNGEPERELQPGGTVTIGIVDGERLIREGARVEANRVNNAGGVGGALTIRLARGTVPDLLARGVRLFVLPCRLGLAGAVSAVSEVDAYAVAPCDDGVLVGSPRVAFTGLSPRAQAVALSDFVDGEAARELPPETARGRRVEPFLGLKTGGASIASPDAPERVVAPPGAPEESLFATFGFPEPGSRTDEFYERFRAVYSRRPETILSALGADALNALAAAIELAASTKPELIAAEVQKGFEVRGVLGELSFPGDTNRAEVDAVIVRLEDGKLRVVG